jgi:putative membrane protein
MAAEKGLSRSEELALLRTRLANERTLLSYVRTALGLGAAGLGLVFLLEGPLTDAFGWMLVALGVAVLVFGVWRFVALRAWLDSQG